MQAREAHRTQERGVFLWRALSASSWDWGRMSPPGGKGEHCSEESLGWCWKAGGQACAKGWVRQGVCWFVCACVHLSVCVCVAKKHVFTYAMYIYLTGAFYVPTSENSMHKMKEWQPKCGAYLGVKSQRARRVRTKGCRAGSGLEELERRDAVPHCQSGWDWTWSEWD